MAIPITIEIRFSAAHYDQWSQNNVQPPQKYSK